MKCKVEVISGDVSQIEADALITAINSGGMWFGGIDGVIQRCAGPWYHNQAAAKQLTDGMTVVARGGSTPHRGKFVDVVFIVDDLRHPLKDVVAAGLRAADAAGMYTVTLPTIRMGVMLGKVEKTAQQAVTEIVTAVQEFVQGPPKCVAHIKIVVYSDDQTERLFRDTLNPAN